MHTQERAEAIDTGIKNANGELIYFLDDDDIVMPDGITLLVSAFSGDFSKIVYGQCDL
ncbi:MAG: glycosyltransferase [Thermodesulfovibrionales bacterium]